MDRGSQPPLARLFRNLTKIASVAGLVVAVALALWQYQRTGLRGPRETISIGFTNEELISLRKLIKPTTSDSSRRGTQVAISQVRDLEERLTALEKAVPLGDSLSAAANNDLRLLQRDIEALKERQIFQGQLIKDQRANFGIR
jgi:hypothetical protein